ncbi:MAG: 2-C-methyl-D-erythritol 4-phosphate cytidylyltransferase [Longimicrobiales bacterium]
MQILAGVVIPAGGAGRRMGGVRKPFLELAGRPLLQHTIEPFLASPNVEHIVVALPADTLGDPPAWLVALHPRVTLVGGGEERGDSVRNGIAALPDDVDVILVHDAARPLVSGEVIERCIAAAAEGRSVVAAVPVTDTIKEVDEGGRIESTPDRRALWAAQTPQAFPAAVIRDAYARALQDRINATDDAALVSRYGATVTIVEGAVDNIKVTSPADLAIAQVLLQQRNA